MKKLLVLSTLSLGALVVTPGSAQAALLMIDDFNNGNSDVILSAPAPQSFSDAVSAAGIIGGGRVIDLDITEGLIGSHRANLFINDRDNTLSLTNGVNSIANLNDGPGLGRTLVFPRSFISAITKNDFVASRLESSVNGSGLQSVPVTGSGNISFVSSLLAILKFLIP
jgi:hypothetical protein